MTLTQNTNKGINFYAKLGSQGHRPVLMGINMKQIQPKANIFLLTPESSSFNNIKRPSKTPYSKGGRTHI